MPIQRTREKSIQRNSFTGDIKPMAEISAAAVKALRDKTGLPMMECKQALSEAGGDEAKAIEELRKKGKKTMGLRSDRETSSGRIAVFADMDRKRGAIVELQCESPSVANHEEFKQLAKDLAQQLALGPGAATVEALLAQPSPSKSGQTLQTQWDDLTNRTREVFRLSRMDRIEGPCGGYAHFDGTTGALVEVSGGTAEMAKDVCMHIAAKSPRALSKEDLDPALVAKEREILAAAARQEGKPENIIEKMIEGRLRNFFAEQVLLEQPFIKEEKITVGKLVQSGGMKLLRFVHWKLGKE
jgi:elongation factor Ts